MNEALLEALAWSIAAIALFSFLSVAAWTSARQREREAYYKSETIKKLAEMRDAPPEPVLQLLREAVATWTKPPSVAMMGPIQARAYYKAETLRKIADIPGVGADAVLAFIREDERVSRIRMREGLKLAGFITCAVGIALAVVLRAVVPEIPVYLTGFIPLLVGISLLAYQATIASKN